MAYRSGRSTIRNIGGISGLAVKFHGAPIVQANIARLRTAVQRRLLRQAVASGLRPVRQAVKSFLRQSEGASRRHEAVGTASRALDQKVAMSKKDASIAYGLVGVRRGYTEFVTLNNTAGGRSNVIHIVKRTSVKKGGATALRYRALKNLGPLARKARLSPKSNSTDKRVPSRYLHLIEKGTYRSRAYRFMELAQRVTFTRASQQFQTNLWQGIVRELGKPKSMARVA